MLRTRMWGHASAAAAHSSRLPANWDFLQEVENSLQKCSALESELFVVFCDTCHFHHRNGR
jgi:hypothetical protein